MAQKSTKNKKSGKIVKNGKKTRTHVVEQNRSKTLVISIILFFLAVFSLIGWFNENALLVRLLIRTERGLFGYGAYAIPAILLWAGIVSLNETERKGPYRFMMVALLPLFLGALISVFNYLAIDWNADPVKVLWEDGVSQMPAGVLSGLLGAVLTGCLTKTGGVIVGVFFLLLSVLALIDIRLIDLMQALKEENPNPPAQKESNAKKLAKSYYAGKETAERKREERRVEREIAQQAAEATRKTEFRFEDILDEEPAEKGTAQNVQVPEKPHTAPVISDEFLPADEEPAKLPKKPVSADAPKAAAYSEPAPIPYTETPPMKKTVYVPDNVPLDPEFEEEPELLTDLFLRKERIPSLSDEAAALVEEAVSSGTAPLPDLSKMLEFEASEYGEPASEPGDYHGDDLETVLKSYRDGESIEFYENGHTEPEMQDPEDDFEESDEDVEELSGEEPVENVADETEELLLPGFNEPAVPEKLPPKKVKPTAKAVTPKQETAPQEPPKYIFPPITLLNPPEYSNASVSAESENNRKLLAETLSSFSIDPNITSIVRGPTVTRFELKLDAGVKFAKISSLSEDIALKLGVSSVRISPIIGKSSVVGIEIPNQSVSTVYIRDVIGSPEFMKSSNTLSFAVGKDIAGNHIIGNIKKLPHLLIAGTTGSGKSVCVNSLIISLLYKSSPEDVRLIMIDPKMVELQSYNGIPHLMLPVVTDPKKASGTLQWAVQEMLRRYSMMAERGTRDVDGYNNAIRDNPERKPIPKLVILIDELADLMMACAKDVEDSICRIAQMGRAAGVHLVVATQRPSANVITGLMKANIPSRIAFAVSSAMESRIILDSGGAETLVGKGDMLFAPLGEGKAKRIQGCFISDDEVERVTDFIKNNSNAQYDSSIQDDINRRAAGNGKSTNNSFVSEPDDSGEDDRDELLYDAVDVILEMDQASVSVLQRKLKVGYARASRIVDQLEEIGIVGPHKGSKPRDILIDKAKWPSVKEGLLSLDECRLPEPG